MNVNKLDEKFLENAGFKYDKRHDWWVFDKADFLLDNIESTIKQQEFLENINSGLNRQSVSIMVTLNDKNQSILAMSLNPDNALSLISKVGYLYVEQLLSIINFFKTSDEGAIEVTKSFLRDKFEFESNGKFSNSRGEYFFGKGDTLIRHSDEFSCLLQEFNYTWQYDKITDLLNI